VIISVFDHLERDRLCGWVFGVLSQVANKKHPELKQISQELLTSVGL